MLGGLGVRLELTFDKLEDIQVALGALLECCGEDDEVTLRVEADRAGLLALTIGPFAADMLAKELERETAEGITLRRVLETVTDRVDVADAPDGAWITLTKQLEAVHG